MVVVVVVVVVVGQGAGRHGQRSGVHLRGGTRHAVLEVRGVWWWWWWWWWLARGLGATDNTPVSTCGEEHMLCWR